MKRKPRTSSHLGPPISRGAAPLELEVIAALNAEIAKPGNTARKLCRSMTPPVSDSVLSRARRGEKVSVPSATACTEFVRSLSCATPPAIAVANAAV